MRQDIHIRFFCRSLTEASQAPNRKNPILAHAQPLRHLLLRELGELHTLYHLNQQRRGLRMRRAYPVKCT